MASEILFPRLLYRDSPGSTALIRNPRGLLWFQSETFSGFRKVKEYPERWWGSALTHSWGQGCGGRGGPYHQPHSSSAAKAVSSSAAGAPARLGNSLGHFRSGFVAKSCQVKLCQQMSFGKRNISLEILLDFEIADKSSWACNSIWLVRLLFAASIQWKKLSGGP